MRIVQFGDSACDRTRRYMDSYVSNELLVETNHEVLSHLENCPECAAELETRSRLKSAVKSAVRREAAPPDLQVRIRDRIQHQRQTRFGLSAGWQRWGLAAAACLTLAVGTLYFRGDAPLPPYGNRPLQNAFIQRISQSLSAVLRVGLGDHVHCSVFSKYEKNPPSIDEMEQTLGPAYKGLLPIVKEKLPGDYRILMAHQCGFNGRRFVHITLRRGSHLVSLVITQRRPGETLADLPASVRTSGIPVYQSSAERFQVAGFETARYLAFVVSDLGTGGNLHVAFDLAPAVHEYLEKVNG